MVSFCTSPIIFQIYVHVHALLNALLIDVSSILIMVGFISGRHTVLMVSCVDKGLTILVVLLLLLLFTRWENTEMPYLYEIINKSDADGAVHVYTLTLKLKLR